MRFVPVLLCLLTACGSAGGGVVTYERQGNGPLAIVEYSKYFEFEDRIADGKVRAHLIITLGPERVPADWRFPPGPLVRDGRLNRRARADGIVEAVYEIYFTNLSDAPIVFEPLELEVRPLGRIELSPSLVFLAPEEFLKTEPIVGVGSSYQPPQTMFWFRYSYQGRSQEIKGVARRLRVDELEKANPRTPPH